MNNITTMFIQSAEGGQDSRNFAYMLFQMYIKYFDKKSIANSFEYISTGREEIQEASITFDCNDENKHILIEEGVHRLVRVSPYDKRQRRHTSFANVFFVKKINIVIEINKKDIRVDCFRAGGKGGQNVNKVSSAVRIVHLPTKLSVESQKERNQIANREDAMNRLKEKLREYEINKLKCRIKTESTSWGKQIRTYSFITEKIVDHNSKREFDLYKTLQGNLDDLFK